LIKQESEKGIKVTVCGGGRGGLSIAGDLTLLGHDVTLFQLPKFISSIEPVIEQKGIKVTGNTLSKKNGLAMPKSITVDPSEAFKEAEVIMVAIPGFGHDDLFEMIVEHLRDGQIIVINTGYWDSLRYKTLLEEHGKDVTIAETNLLVYLTSLVNPGEVYISATKDKVKIAAMPATENKRVLEVVQKLYPQFEEATSVLEINLSNLNGFLHAPVVTSNLGFIEKLGAEPFYFYRDGVTKSVGRIMEEVDKERRAIAKALDIEVPTIMESYKEMYSPFGAKGTSMYEIIRTNKSAQEFAMETATSAYDMTAEDIPCSFIPLIRLGEHLGVNVTVMKSLVELLSIGIDKDYESNAIALEDLGLSEMSPAQIKNYVLHG